MTHTTAPFASDTRLLPTILLILDGWGIAPAGDGNATSLAHTPNMDMLLAKSVHSTLQASGRAVGLPEGYIGNSEVGHLNIGAGSVVYQDMTRIDVAMETGELATNAVYTELMRKTQIANGGSGRLHLAGLLSDGGVHSHYSHMKALTQVAVEAGLDVFLHCFMDGRDTPPDKGVNYLQDVQSFLETLKDKKGKACIASLCGRFYVMDRDTRWERVEKAWDLLLRGKSMTPEQPIACSADAVEMVKNFYAAGITDEFMLPTLLVQNAHWQKDDGIFFFNFRADRMRELVKALTEVDFNGFERGAVPEFAEIASMTCYEASFTLPIAFPKESLKMGLGEVVSSWGEKQLRIAETEKYAHVTYFFNGGREEPFPNEDRVLVPSPRDVATYDLAPAMSCHEVTQKCLEAYKSGEYALVVCNLANGDMVGHTGIIPAAVAACEAVDICLGKFIETVRAMKGRLMIIADHGNCEAMIDAQGKPQTAHTTNLVPCILVQEDEKVSLHAGKLADVAPTLINLWNKDVPDTMTGKVLVEPIA